MPEPRRRGDPAGPGPMLEAALDYCSRGWPVLPCEPRGKRPAGALVPHGLKDASTDPDVVAGWWKAEPEANIGLRTGVAFDVLDVDGDEGMAALAVEIPFDAPTVDGPTVTTGKGAHVYVAVTGLGNRAGILPAVDWRGKGGYVVAPPSVHPSGAAYVWKCGEDDLAFGANAPIRPAPAWLLDLLNRRPATALLPNGRSTSTSAYGRRALEAECGRLALAPEGQRNHTLNAAAFALGQLVASSALSADEVIVSLVEVARRIGLTDTEVEGTIESGMTAGLRSPRGAA
jgi:hypothetical protein